MVSRSEGVIVELKAAMIEVYSQRAKVLGL